MASGYSAFAPGPSQPARFRLEARFHNHFQKSVSVFEKEILFIDFQILTKMHFLFQMVYTLPRSPLSSPEIVLLTT